MSGTESKHRVFIAHHSADLAGGRLGFLRGFADLLDLNAPPASVRILPPQETTRRGFAYTGEALHRALAKARERFGE